MFKQSTKVLRRYRLLFRISLFLAIIFFIIFNLSYISLAQEQEELSKEKQDEIVRVLCEKLEKLYPDPEIAKKNKCHY